MMDDNRRGNMGLLGIREFSKSRVREKLLWKVRWSKSSMKFLKMEETLKRWKKEIKQTKSLIRAGESQ